MKSTRWMPALALALAPTLTFAQDRTSDSTRSQGSTSSKMDDAAKGAKGSPDSAAPQAKEAKEAMGGAIDHGKKAMGPDDDATGPQHTLWKLHQDNQDEIAMGELAKKNAASPEAKKFGAQLVKDHKAADDKVRQWAKKLDADLERQPSATDKAEMEASKAKMEELRAMKGSEFDAGFAKAMADDHKKSIDMVTTARNDASQKEIKPLLDELLPKLQQHAHMAMAMENGKGGVNARPQGRRATKP